MKRLDGKTAVVTGAASGIGRALVRELAGRGARVLAIDLRAAESASPLVESRLCDVTDEAAVKALAAEFAQQHGAADLLFVNAGVAAVGSLETMPLEDARWVIEVNVIGAMIVTGAFVPAMVRAGTGAVIFTGSIAGLVGVPEMSVYSASKFAVVGYADSLRSELWSRGVSVTTLCPGFVRTGLHEATRYHTPAIQRLLDAPPPGFRGLDAQDVAQRAVDAALARRAVLSLGVERFGAAFGRLTPGLYARAASRLRSYLGRRP
ncbi:MAG: SDR family oxidoreductase [Myxococcota bacterium]